MGIDKKDESEVKQTNPSMEGASNDVRDQELADLRRQRGCKRAAVTRVSKTVDTELSRKANRKCIQEVSERVNEAFTDLRKIHQIYESKLREEEIEEAQEYADRLEEEECTLRGKIQQYLQQLDETRSSMTTSRQSHRSAKSRASAVSAVSMRSREAAVELDDADLKLRDVRAQLEEERQIKIAKRESEKRRQQEQWESEKRRQQEQLESEKEQWELEERDRALQLKVAEDARERAARKARLYRAAEDELNWDRRHDFEESAAVAAERNTSATRGNNVACAETSDIPKQKKAEGAVQEGPAEASPQDRHRPTVRQSVNEESNSAESADCHRESPKVGDNSLNPNTWGMSKSDRHEPKSLRSSAFAKSVPRLSLPQFAGDPSEWPRWVSLFRALVHDQASLSDTERMTYLQQAVDGAAHQAIGGFLFDGRMYHQALARLYERFGREGDVSQAYLSDMFSTPAPSISNLASMERFSSAISNTVMTLRTLGYHHDLAASENLRRVVSKLPAELTYQWGREVNQRYPSQPNLETFSVWLETEVTILRNTVTQSRDPERKKTTAPSRDTWTRRTTLTTATTPSQAESRNRRWPCVLCKEEHKLQDCPEFQLKTLEERLAVVSKERLCWGCLNKGHFMRVCRSAKRCNLNGCQATHHRLVHKDRSDSSVGANNTEAKTEAREGSRVVGVALTETTDTLLQLVPVRIHGPRGDRDVVALLDPGAQTSLCCEDVLNELGVQGTREDLRLQNIEGSGPRQSSLRVQLTVSPLSSATKGRHILVPEVWSVPKLNVSAPSVSSKQLHSWKHLQDLDLRQYNGERIELLLGANILEAVLQREARVGGIGQPVGVRTDFGWTLTGSISTLVPSTMRHVMFVRRQSEEGLTDLVQEWWATEAFGTKVNSPDARSQEDIRALKSLDQHTTKVGDRYETGLLWGEEEPKFPNNWKQAYHRLECTERKLEKQPELAEKYKATIDGYVAEEHARKVSAKEMQEQKEKRWYLPHHAVVNQNKPGKERMAAAAAASVPARAAPMAAAASAWASSRAERMAAATSAAVAARAAVAAASAREARA